jgi:hypothetical protein
MKLIKSIAAALVLMLCLNTFGAVYAAELVLSKLVLSKNEVVLEIGATYSLTANAVYTDGSAANVTVQTTWSSEFPAVASIYNGTISAKTVGTTTVTATFKGEVIPVKVTVTKKVKTLTKDTQKAQIRINESKKITLTATYSDNSTQDATADADWTSSDEEVATVVNGTIRGHSSGTATVKATLGSESVTIPVEVELVKRLDANKEDLSLLLKDKETIELIATYPDGSTRNVAAEAEWTTSNDKVADVLKGVITAYGAGEATITATYGTKTTTLTVDVDKASKLDLDVSSLFLKINDKKQVKLTTTYPNGTSADMTGQATWSSSNPDVAFVSKGQISAYKTGDATISATYGGKTVTVAVDVEVPRFLELPDPTMTLRTLDTKNLSLKATYRDGTTEEVAAKATWTSSDEKIAYVTAGTVYAPSRGSAKLTGSYGGKTVTLTVDVDVPSKLTVNNKTVALDIKGTAQPVIIATFADGREQVVTDKAEWSTSAEKYVEVSADGTITGVASGTATVTARFDSKSVAITVNVALASKLTTDVRTLYLNSKETRVIVLTATDSAGVSKNVTSDAEWKTSNAKVAEVDGGFVTAFSSGDATITATYGGKNTTVSVQVDIIQKLEASKRFISLQSGETSKLVLTATINGAKKDVTADADWSSTSYKIADVKDGAVTGVAYGKATLTAKYGNKSVTIAVDVDTIKYLQVSQVNVTMKAGTKYTVSALATYASGTERDVSVTALWSSSRDSIADVKDGIIRANGKGKATITVTFAGKKKTVNVVVTP